MFTSFKLILPSLETGLFYFLTAVMLCYPYFSYDPVVIPVFCLCVHALALWLYLSKKEINPFGIWSGLYLLFIFPAILISPGPVIYESGFVLLLTSLSYGYCASHLLKHFESKRVYLTILFTLAVLMSLYGFWQYFWGFKGFQEYYLHHPEVIPSYIQNNPQISQVFYSKISLSRIYSVFTNPNIFASFLLITLPVFFLYIHPLKPVKFLLLALPVSALLMTQSISALILLSASPVLIFCFYKGRRETFYLLLASILPVLTSPCFKSFFKALPSSFESRLNYWLNTFTSIYSSPYLGNGWNTFSDLFIQKVTLHEEITQYAHNHILELISETGLLFGILIVTLYLFALTSPSKGSPKTVITEQKTSPKLLYLIPLLLSTLSIFHPPFTAITPEYSPLFSILFWIISPFIACFAYSNLFINASRNNLILGVSALLIFIHSLVDFNLETMGIKILFWGLLGIVLNGCTLFLIPKIFFYFIRIIQALVLILGACTVLSFPTHNNQKQLTFFLLELKNTLSLHSRIMPEDIKKMNCFIQKQKYSYIPSYEFSKLCYQYPSDPLFSPLGINLIEQSVLKAPANQRLHLLKARFLERIGSKKDALSLYVKLLINHSMYKKWNYIFILNDEELQFISTRIQELKNTNENI